MSLRRSSRKAATVASANLAEIVAQDSDDDVLNQDAETSDSDNATPPPANPVKRKAPSLKQKGKAKPKHKAVQSNTAPATNEGHEHGPEDRLRSLKKPRISVSSRFAYSTADAGTKPKRSTGSRNAGKLVKLMELPVDVFFEIMSRLHPLDILHLSRVSKSFRATFRPEKTLHIWVAARKNVPGLPPCPADLNEAQYASLLFEHTCNACGVPRAKKLDYSLRVRFCGPCFNENVQSGSILARPYGNSKMPQIIYSLVPRSLIKGHGVETKTNAFYAPEFTVIADRYLELADDPVAQEKFAHEQKAIAAKMLESGRALTVWEMECSRDKSLDDEERSNAREASIRAKLIALGHDPEDFPKGWDHGWAALVRQPRELTDRIWKTILPKLEAAIRERINDKVAERRVARYQTRSREFLQHYNTHILSYSEDFRPFMPNEFDAPNLPTVKTLVEESDGMIPFDLARWEGAKDKVMVEADVHRRMVRADLLEMTTPGYDRYKYGYASSQQSEPEPEVTIPSSYVYHCLKWPCSVSSATFCPRTLMDHHHMRSNPWKEAFQEIVSVFHVVDITTTLLACLGLPESIEQEGLDNMNGRLVCACGDPEITGPFEWGQLVAHISRSRKWHTTTNSIEGSLFDDHASDCLASIVKLLEPGQSFVSPIPTPMTTTLPPSFVKRCAICQTMGTYQLLTSHADVQYHLRAKHHTEPDDSLVEDT